MASLDVFKNVLFNFTLPHEGGKKFTNIPGDNGGPTYCGIIQKTYDEYRKNKNLPIQSVKIATDDEVGEIYQKMYWFAAGCDKLDDKLAIVVFDFSVNGGVSRAIRYLSLTKNPNIYLDNRAGFYKKIVQNNSSQNKFLKGWLNRVEDLRKFIV